jgi:hypothetical protein
MGADFHDGGNGGRKVDAGTLTETLCHEPCFEAINGAIGVRFDFEDPFVADGVTTKRKISHTEVAFDIKRSELRPDGGFPFRGILGGHCVLEVYMNRNVGGMWIGEIRSGTRK